LAFCEYLRRLIATQTLAVGLEVANSRRIT